MMFLRVCAVTPIFLFVIGCSDQRIQSNWARTSPSIDGSLEEWSSASLTVFDDLQVSVGVGNDSSYLYLAGRVANPSLQRMIEQAGVGIWLDPDGGRGKDLEIRFPVSRFAQGNTTRAGFWEVMTEEQKVKARQKMEEMQRGILVIDRLSIDSRVFPPGNPEGFAGIIDESMGILAFEARIPLQMQKIFPKFNGMESGKTVKIGFELGGSVGNRPAVRNSDSPPSTRGGSGTQGRGRPRGNVPQRSSQTSEKNEIWLEVSLAQPQ